MLSERAGKRAGARAGEEGEVGEVGEEGEAAAVAALVAAGTAPAEGVEAAGTGSAGPEAAREGVFGEQQSCVSGPVSGIEGEYLSRLRRNATLMREHC